MLNKLSLLLLIIILLIPLYLINFNRLEKADIDILHKKYEMNFLDSNKEPYSGAKIEWVIRSKKEYDITTPIMIKGNIYVESDNVVYQINDKKGKPMFNFKNEHLNVKQENNVAHHLKDPKSKPNIITIHEKDLNLIKVIDKEKNIVLWECEPEFPDDSIDSYIATPNVLFVEITSRGYKIGNMYSGTTKYLYAYDIETGKLLFDGIESIDLEKVWNLENHLLTMLKNDFALIDKNTGEILWTYSYKNHLSSKQVHDGFLYLVDSGGNLEVINLSTGQLAWERKDIRVDSHDYFTENDSTFPASFLKERIYISRQGGLTVLDYKTGQTIWEFSIEDNADEIYINFSDPVAIKNNILYASSTNGLLFAIRIAE